MDIETPRLILRLIPMVVLAATTARDRDACRRHFGRAMPDEWFDDAWVAEMRLKQWQEDPAFGPWSIRALIWKDTGDIAGAINCHDRPRPMEHDGQSGLMVELGYDVYQDWRRRGIATEAIGAMVQFAAGHSVRWIRLSISPGNKPSLALARKLGAYKIGTQIDEIDGPEDVFLVDV
jgi:ribosomal-protein-alanine N-acetyltransferase